MQRSEFDRFADEYQALHQNSTAFSGEAPEYFAAYKIRNLAELVAAKSPGVERGRFLDFGAGVGTSIPFFSRYLPGARLTCLDISAKSIEIARQRFPDLAEFVVFDGADLPFDDGSFDFAYSACVFHHIPPAEHVRLLAELRRVLKPGGYLVIFEHNPYNPLTMRVVNTCPFDADAIVIKAHSMKERFAAAGLNACEIRYRLFFPRFMSWLRWTERALGWLPLGAQYYAIGRR